MVGAIWGQTRNLGDRTLGTGGPDRAPVGRSRPAAAPGYGDRHDVRYTDQERLTPNVQLSTFNGVTGRADGGREWGQTRNCDDLTFDPLDLTKHRSGGRGRPRCRDMGTGTMSDILIRNV